MAPPELAPKFSADFQCVTHGVFGGAAVVAFIVISAIADVPNAMEAATDRPSKIFFIIITPINIWNIYFQMY